MDDTAGAQAGTGPGGGPVILVVDNNPDTAGTIIPLARRPPAAARAARRCAPRPGRLRDGVRHPCSSGLRRRADPHFHRAAARDTREVEGTAFSTKPIEPRRLAGARRMCPLA